MASMATVCLQRTLPLQAVQARAAAVVCGLGPLQQRTQESARFLSLSAPACVRLKRPVFEGKEPPRKPPNPYMLFMLESVKDGPKTELGRLDMKAIGERWRNLSNTEQKKYEKLAKRKKLEYEKDYKVFLSKIGGQKKQQAYLESLKKYKAEKRAYLKDFRLKRQNLLKPRKKSGYNLFVAELMGKAEVASLEQTQEVMKGAAEKWNSLNAKEKELYNEDATLAHEKALKEYERRCKQAEKEGMVPQSEGAGKKAAAKKVSTKKTTAAKKATTEDAAAATVADDEAEDLAAVEERDENSLGGGGEASEQGEDIFADSDSDSDFVEEPGQSTAP